MVKNTESQSSDILCDIDVNGIAILTLNKVSKNNAFDDEMIDGLIHYLDTLAAIPTLRCLVLSANGKHFSAGADLHWMKSMASKSQLENRQSAERLARLMSTLDTFPRPTIAAIQGSAFGGALGLICCCDIAIGQADTQFCFSEVKLGLIPATIAPYVCRAIGVRAAKRYMLTAERIDAHTAQHIGLLHQVVNDEVDTSLEVQVSKITHALLANSPSALVQAKILCKRCENQPIDKELIRYTSEMIADIRVSKHGQEGISAFFEKRAPSWILEVKEGGE
jgi:methylglutaconyl-CoA hydratase